MDLEREHPGVKQSMLKALGNVAPRHLLDTRLNPPAELRATVRQEGSDEVRLQSDTTRNRPDASADTRLLLSCDSFDRRTRPP